MSLGPSQPEEQLGASRFAKTNFVIKKVVQEYFRDPLSYLFYAALLGLILTLLLGFRPNNGIYVILALLSLTQLLPWYRKEKPYIKRLWKQKPRKKT